MEIWRKRIKNALIELFNTIIEKNQMPQEWETGLVINIHKKGTKSKCENDRGIILLRTAYKLFANRLNEHLEDKMVEE